MYVLISINQIITLGEAKFFPEGIPGFVPGEGDKRHLVDTLCFQRIHSRSHQLLA